MNDTVEIKDHYPKNKPTRPGQYFWRWDQTVHGSPGPWQGPLRITQAELDNSEVDSPCADPLCRPDVEFGERCLSQKSLKKLRTLTNSLVGKYASSQIEKVVGKKLQAILEED